VLKENHTRKQLTCSRQPKVKMLCTWWDLLFF
jgi:hypothetical protein